MKIIEYGTEIQHAVLFSNGVDKELVTSLGVDCLVIDLQLTKAYFTVGMRNEVASELETYGITRALLVGTYACKFILDKRFSKLDRAHGGMYLLDSGIIAVPTFECSSNPFVKSCIQRDIEIFKTGVWKDIECQTVTIPLGYDPFVNPDSSVMPKLSEVIYIDIETDSLEFSKDNPINSVQIATDNDDIVYYIEHPTFEFLLELYYGIVYTGCTVVFHNAVFDCSMLTVHTDMDWLNLTNIRCTQVLARARGLTKTNLKHLTVMYTPINNPEAYQQYVGSYDKSYACVDALATKYLYRRLTKKGIRDIDYLACNTMRVFAKAHLNGIALDQEALKKACVEQEQLIDGLHEILLEFADINWNAYHEVSVALKDNKVPLKERTKTKQYSVSSEVLEPLREKYPIVDTLLQWREATKLYGTFYKKYLDAGTKTIHPSMLVLGADTGRSVCNNPNIQQVPSKVKKVFVSRFEGGSIAQFDLAQSELRCAVFISGDTVMSEALQGSDYHRTVAANAFNIPYEEVTKAQRQISKIVSFGALMYGGTAKGIANRAGVDAELVQQAIDMVTQQFSKLTQWQTVTIQKAYNTLRVLSPYGHIRDLTEVQYYGYGNGMGNVKRAAINTPIQGLSAFICYELCCYIDQEIVRRRLQSKFIAQVHDSVFLDVHPDEVDIIADICKVAFKYLNTTPLSKLPGWGMLQVKGELTFNRTMYEETEEGKGIVLES